MHYGEQSLNIEYLLDLRRSLDLNDSKTRGHAYRFSREKFSAKRANDYSRFVTIRQKFLLNRVASLWNSQASQVVTAQSPNSFKASTDKFLRAAAIAQEQC